MAEKNGFVKTIFWTLILASFGWTTFIGIGTMKVCADEAAKRETCDKEIIEKIDTKLEKQQKTQQDMLIMLAEINKDMKRVLKDNGNK